MIPTPNQGYKGIRVQIYEPPPLPLGTLTLNPSGVTKPLPFPNCVLAELCIRHFKSGDSLYGSATVTYECLNKSDARRRATESKSVQRLAMNWTHVPNYPYLR